MKYGSMLPGYSLYSSYVLHVRMSIYRILHVSGYQWCTQASIHSFIHSLSHSFIWIEEDCHGIRWQVMLHCCRNQNTLESKIGENLWKFSQRLFVIEKIFLGVFFLFSVELRVSPIQWSTSENFVYTRLNLFWLTKYENRSFALKRK